MNMVKEEFKGVVLHDGGGLNLMVTRDTQSSRKVDINGYRGVFFLTFGFKDAYLSRFFIKTSTGYPPACWGEESGLVRTLGWGSLSRNAPQLAVGFFTICGIVLLRVVKATSLISSRVSFDTGTSNSSFENPTPFILETLKNNLIGFSILVNIKLSADSSHILISSANALVLTEKIYVLLLSLLIISFNFPSMLFL